MKAMKWLIMQAIAGMWKYLVHMGGLNVLELPTEVVMILKRMRKQQEKHFEHVVSLTNQKS